MKKFFVILTSLWLVFTLQATSKGRPVRLGSLSGYIGKPKSNRAPAKELVSLYQEDAALHVNVVAGLLVTVTVKDEDDNILSQELVTAQESDMVIPMGGAIRHELYFGVGLLNLYVIQVSQVQKLMKLKELSLPTVAEELRQ